MTNEELISHLEELYNNIDESGISVYVILKGEEAQGPKKLDIENISTSELKGLFVESLKELISDNEDLSLINLSASDDRSNAIYLYDLDVPNELRVLDEVIANDNLPLFSVAADHLQNIKALLIEIGNNEQQVVLYKTIAPINIFGRGSFFLKKDDHRFKKIDDEFIRISSGFQLLKIGGELLVIDLNTIEKFFGFHEVIKKEAMRGVDAIRDMALVENIEALEGLLEDVKYARKFTKISKDSPVIEAHIENSHIIEFCKNFPMLSGRIRFNEDETKIRLDTKVSKNLFIQLLMDNFLTSELTAYHYKSLAKDGVE